MFSKFSIGHLINSRLSKQKIVILHHTLDRFKTHRAASQPGSLPSLKIENIPMPASVKLIWAPPWENYKKSAPYKVLGCQNCLKIKVIFVLQQKKCQNLAESWKHFLGMRLGTCTDIKTELVEVFKIQNSCS